MRYLLLPYGEPVPPGVPTSELWEQVVALHTDFSRLVTDGPFAETKEVLGGYYLIEADSLDAAVAWAHRLQHYGKGSIEVRPVVTEYETVA